MNCSVYIFGELSSGYTQYPEDSSSLVLKKLHQLCKAPTQIAIHRDANMMFYCYIRKLNNNKYIGLGIAVNGYYIARIEELFSLFESTIEKIAQQGIFVHYAVDGTLTTSTIALKNEEEEIDVLSESLRIGFENLGRTTNILPQVDYTVAKDSLKEFNVQEDCRDIVRASYTYGYTYIYKNQDYNSIRMNSYMAILSRINNENNSLKQINEKLKKENAKILRQKKQFQLVVFLFLAILGCGIGLFFLSDNLNMTKNELADANNTISIQNDSIKSKNNQISKLHKEIHNLNGRLANETKKRKQLESEYNSFKSSFSSEIPIFITNIEIGNIYYDGTIETNYGGSIYSSKSMFLKPRITYTGIRTGNSITLYTKLYGPSGTLQTGNSSPNGYTFSESMTVSGGEGNSYALSGWGGSNKGFWGRGTYRYEIWYGSICLKSKTFTIY